MACATNIGYLPFAKVNKKSWKGDFLKLQKDLYPALGKLPMNAIAFRDIQKCLTVVKARVSAGTYNKYLTLVNRMFNLAIQWGFLEDNPCKFLKKFKVSGGRERYLSDDEIKRLLTALNAYDENPSADSVKFLLYTGMRMSEALKLTWKHVNFELGTAFLEDTKSGKSRTVVLNDLALQVLNEIKGRGGKSEYVFPGKYGKGRLMSPKRVFESAKLSAGITDCRIHDLRHTHASIAANNGASLYEIQKLLGHSSSAMSQRYAHLGDKELKAVTDGIAKKIEQAVV